MRVTVKELLIELGIDPNMSNRGPGRAIVRKLRAAGYRPILTRVNGKVVRQWTRDKVELGLGEQELKKLEELLK